MADEIQKATDDLRALLQAIEAVNATKEGAAQLKPVMQEIGGKEGMAAYAMGVDTKNAGFYVDQLNEMIEKHERVNDLIRQQIQLTQSAAAASSGTIRGSESTSGDEASLRSTVASRPPGITTVDRFVRYARRNPTALDIPADTYDEETVKKLLRLQQGVMEYSQGRTDRGQQAQMGLDFRSLFPIPTNDRQDSQNFALVSGGGVPLRRSVGNRPRGVSDVDSFVKYVLQNPHSLDIPEDTYDEETTKKLLRLQRGVAEYSQGRSNRRDQAQMGRDFRSVFPVPATALPQDTRSSISAMVSAALNHIGMGDRPAVRNLDTANDQYLLDVLDSVLDRIAVLDPDTGVPKQALVPKSLVRSQINRAVKGIDKVVANAVKRRSYDLSETDLMDSDAPEWYRALNADFEDSGLGVNATAENLGMNVYKGPGATGNFKVAPRNADGGTVYSKKQKFGKSSNDEARSSLRKSIRGDWRALEETADTDEYSAGSQVSGYEATAVFPVSSSQKISEDIKAQRRQVNEEIISGDMEPVEIGGKIVQVPRSLAQKKDVIVRAVRAMSKDTSLVGRRAQEGGTKEETGIYGSGSLEQEAVNLHAAAVLERYLSNPAERIESSFDSDFMQRVVIQETEDTPNAETQNAGRLYAQRSIESLEAIAIAANERRQRSTNRSDRDKQERVMTEAIHQKEFIEDLLFDEVPEGATEESAKVYRAMLAERRGEMLKVSLRGLSAKQKARRRSVKKKMTDDLISRGYTKEQVLEIGERYRVGTISDEERELFKPIIDFDRDTPRTEEVKGKYEPFTVDQALAYIYGSDLTQVPDFKDASIGIRKYATEVSEGLAAQGEVISPPLPRVEKDKTPAKTKDAVLEIGRTTAMEEAGRGTGTGVMRRFLRFGEEYGPNERYAERLIQLSNSKDEVERREALETIALHRAVAAARGYNPDDYAQGGIVGENEGFTGDNVARANQFLNYVALKRRADNGDEGAQEDIIAIDKQRKYVQELDAGTRDIPDFQYQPMLGEGAFTRVSKTGRSLFQNTPYSGQIKKALMQDKYGEDVYESGVDLTGLVAEIESAEIPDDISSSDEAARRQAIIDRNPDLRAQIARVNRDVNRIGREDQDSILLPHDLSDVTPGGEADQIDDILMQLIQQREYVDSEGVTAVPETRRSYEAENMVEAQLKQMAEDAAKRLANTEAATTESELGEDERTLLSRAERITVQKRLGLFDAPAQPRTGTVVKNLKGVNAVVQAERRGEGVSTLRKQGVGNAHYGNPFTLQKPQAGEVPVTSVKEAVDRYKAWLAGTADQDVKPEQRDWILSQIDAGALDDKDLLYYTQLNEPSHADALAEFVNNRKQSVPASEPTVKPAAPITQTLTSKEKEQVFQIRKRLVKNATRKMALDPERAVVGGRGLPQLLEIASERSEDRTQNESAYELTRSLQNLEPEDIKFLNQYDFSIKKQREEAANKGSAVVRRLLGSINFDDKDIESILSYNPVVGLGEENTRRGTNDSTRVEREAKTSLRQIASDTASVIEASQLNLSYRPEPTKTERIERTLAKISKLDLTDDEDLLEAESIAGINAKDRRRTPKLRRQAIQQFVDNQKQALIADLTPEVALEDAAQRRLELLQPRAEEPDVAALTEPKAPVVSMTQEERKELEYRQERAEAYLDELEKTERETPEAIASIAMTKAYEAASKKTTWLSEKELSQAEKAAGFSKFTKFEPLTEAERKAQLIKNSQSVLKNFEHYVTFDLAGDDISKLEEEMGISGSEGLDTFRRRAQLIESFRLASQKDQARFASEDIGDEEITKAEEAAGLSRYRGTEPLTDTERVKRLEAHIESLKASAESLKIARRATPESQAVREFPITGFEDATESSFSEKLTKAEEIMGVSSTDVAPPPTSTEVPLTREERIARLRGYVRELRNAYLATPAAQRYNAVGDYQRYETKDFDDEALAITEKIMGLDEFHPGTKRKMSKKKRQERARDYVASTDRAVDENPEYQNYNALDTFDMSTLDDDELAYAEIEMMRIDAAKLKPIVEPVVIAPPPTSTEVPLTREERVARARVHEVALRKALETTPEETAYRAIESYEGYNPNQYDVEELVKVEKAMGVDEFHPGTKRKMSLKKRQERAASYVDSRSEATKGTVAYKAYYDFPYSYEAMTDEDLAKAEEIMARAATKPEPVVEPIAPPAPKAEKPKRTRTKREKPVKKVTPPLAEIVKVPQPEPEPEPVVTPPPATTALAVVPKTPPPPTTALAVVPKTPPPATTALAVVPKTPAPVPPTPAGPIITPPPASTALAVVPKTPAPAATAPATPAGPPPPSTTATPTSTTALATVPKTPTPSTSPTTPLIVFSGASVPFTMPVLTPTPTATPPATRTRKPKPAPVPVVPFSGEASAPLTMPVIPPAAPATPPATATPRAPRTPRAPKPTPAPVVPFSGASVPFTMPVFPPTPTATPRAPRTPRAPKPTPAPVVPFTSATPFTPFTPPVIPPVAPATAPATTTASTAPSGGGITAPGATITVTGGTVTITGSTVTGGTGGAGGTGGGGGGGGAPSTSGPSSGGGGGFRRSNLTDMVFAQMDVLSDRTKDVIREAPDEPARIAIVQAARDRYAKLQQKALQTQLDYGSTSYGVTNPVVTGLVASLSTSTQPLQDLNTMTESVLQDQIASAVERDRIENDPTLSAADRKLELAALDESDRELNAFAAVLKKVTEDLNRFQQAVRVPNTAFGNTSGRSGGSGGPTIRTASGKVLSESDVLALSDLESKRNLYASFQGNLPNFGSRFDSQLDLTRRTRGFANATLSQLPAVDLSGVDFMGDVAKENEAIAAAARLQDAIAQIKPNTIETRPIEELAVDLSRVNEAAIQLNNVIEGAGNVDAAQSGIQNVVTATGFAERQQARSGAEIDKQSASNARNLEENMQAIVSQPGLLRRLTGGVQREGAEHVREYLRGVFGDSPEGLRATETMFYRDQMIAYDDRGRRRNIVGASTKELQNLQARVKTESGMDVSMDDLQRVQRAMARVQQARNQSPLNDTFSYAMSRMRDIQTLGQTAMGLLNAPQTISSTISQVGDPQLRGDRILTTARALSLSPETYTKALAAATQQQSRFGGTLTRNLEDMTSFIPISNTYGVDVGKSVQVARKLAAFDPAQGMQGASIALKEFLSGNVSSLSRRFEINRSDLSKINTGDANEMLDSLDTLLAKMGVTDKLIDDQANSLATKYDRMTGRLETMQVSFSAFAIGAMTPLLEPILGDNSFLARGALDQNLQKVVTERLKSYGDSILSDPKTGLRTVDVFSSNFMQQLDPLLGKANDETSTAALDFTAVTGNVSNVELYRRMGNMNASDRRRIQQSAQMSVLMGMNKEPALLKAMRDIGGDFFSGEEYQAQRRPLGFYGPAMSPMIRSNLSKQAGEAMRFGQRGQQVQILKQFDADTYEIKLPNGTTDIVRLAGVDVPEKITTEGKQANAFARTLTGDLNDSANKKRFATLYSTGAREGYGRLMGSLAIDGRDIGTELVATGNAAVYNFENSYSQDLMAPLTALERNAANIGMGPINAESARLGLGANAEISQAVRDRYFRNTYLGTAGLFAGGGASAAGGVLGAINTTRMLGAAGTFLTGGAATGVASIPALPYVLGGAVLAGAGYLGYAAYTDSQDSSSSKMRELQRLQSEEDLRIQAESVANQVYPQAARENQIERDRELNAMRGPSGSTGLIGAMVGNYFSETDSQRARDEFVTEYVNTGKELSKHYNGLSADQKKVYGLVVNDPITKERTTVFKAIQMYQTLINRDITNTDNTAKSLLDQNQTKYDVLSRQIYDTMQASKLIEIAQEYGIETTYQASFAGKGPPRASRYMNSVTSVMDQQQFFNLNDDQRASVAKQLNDAINTPSWKRFAREYTDQAMEKQAAMSQQRFTTFVDSTALNSLAGMNPGQLGSSVFGFRTNYGRMPESPVDSEGNPISALAAPSLRAMGRTIFNEGVKYNKSGQKDLETAQVEAVKVLEQQIVAYREQEELTRPFNLALKSTYSNFIQTLRSSSNQYNNIMTYMSQGNPRGFLDISQQMSGFNMQSILQNRITTQNGGVMGIGNPVTMGTSGPTPTGRSFSYGYTAGPQGTLSYTRDFMKAPERSLYSPAVIESVIMQGVQANTEIVQRNIQFGRQMRDADINNKRAIEDINRNGMRSLEDIHRTYTRNMIQLAQQSETSKRLGTAQFYTGAVAANIDPSEKARITASREQGQQKASHVEQADVGTYLKSASGMQDTELQTAYAEYQAVPFTNYNEKEASWKKVMALVQIRRGQSEARIKNATTVPERSAAEEQFGLLSNNYDRGQQYRKYVDDMYNQQIEFAGKKKQLGINRVDLEREGTRLREKAPELQVQLSKARTPEEIRAARNAIEDNNVAIQKNSEALQQNARDLESVTITAPLWADNWREAGKNILESSSSTISGLLNNLEDFNIQYARNLEDAYRGFKTAKEDMIRQFTDAATEISQAVPAEFAGALSAITSYQRLSLKAEAYYNSGNVEAAQSLQKLANYDLASSLYPKGSEEYKSMVNQLNSNVTSMTAAGMKRDDLTMGPSGLGAYGEVGEDGKYYLRVIMRTGSGINTSTPQTSPSVPPGGDGQTGPTQPGVGGQG